MSSLKKAWSRYLWREVAKNLNNPTVSAIVEECKHICRGVFPHRENKTLIFKDGQTALWKNLTKEEKNRWNNALAGWGWLKEHNEPIFWNKDTERDIARLGIWVWTRNMDGAMPKVLAAGALKRRDFLEEQVLFLNNHDVWRKIGAQGLTTVERLDRADELLLNAKGEHEIINQWLNAEKELRWKNENIRKLEVWFNKHPAIPPATRELWINSWKRT